MASLANLRCIAKQLVGEEMSDEVLQSAIHYCQQDGKGEITLENFCERVLEREDPAWPET